MFELRDLTIHSGSRCLVRELSLTLPPQGVTALIGPSGCGKSTVLKWLAGLLAPGLTARGELRLEGSDIIRPDPRLTWQPQSDALFPWLTIAANVTLPLRLSGLCPTEASRRLAPLFASFGLSGTGPLYPSELSGGMRQRAAFLRSMARHSPYLLLDEPFSALDAVTRLKMQLWLRARLAARPCSVLLVTHDLSEATALADRILVMAANPGRIIADLPVPLPPHQRSEAALAGLRDTLKSLLLKE